MRHEQIRQLLTAQPFRQFTIHLPEGRAVPVTHHDFALVSPDGRTLVVYDHDGVADIITRSDSDSNSNRADEVRFLCVREFAVPPNFLV